MIVCFVWFVHWLEEIELNEAPESSEKFRSSRYNFDEHAQSRNVNIIPSGNVASDTAVSRGARISSPYKRLLNQEQHSFPIVLFVLSADQSTVLKLSVDKLNTTHKFVIV